MDKPEQLTADQIERYSASMHDPILVANQNGHYVLYSRHREIVESQARRIAELQEAYDKLTGEKFSDRAHAALHSRITELEREKALAIAAIDSIRDAHGMPSTISYVLKTMYESRGRRIEELEQQVREYQEAESLNEQRSLETTARLHMNALHQDASEVKGKALEEATRRAEDLEWWSKVCYPEGMTAEQVQNELADFHFMMEQVPKVYMAVTDGLLSKPTYYAQSVIDVFNSYTERLIEEAIKDDREDRAAQPTAKPPHEREPPHCPTCECGAQPTRAPLLSDEADALIRRLRAEGMETARIEYDGMVLTIKPLSKSEPPSDVLDCATDYCDRCGASMEHKPECPESIQERKKRSYLSTESCSKVPALWHAYSQARSRPSHFSEAS